MGIPSKNVSINRKGNQWHVFAPLQQAGCQSLPLAVGPRVTLHLLILSSLLGASRSSLDPVAADQAHQHSLRCNPTAGAVGRSDISTVPAALQEGRNGVLGDAPSGCQQIATRPGSHGEDPPLSSSYTTRIRPAARHLLQASSPSQAANPGPAPSPTTNDNAGNESARSLSSYGQDIIWSGLWAYIVAAVWLLIGAFLLLAALISSVSRMSSQFLFSPKIFDRPGSLGIRPRGARRGRLLPSLFFLACVPILVGLGLGFGANPKLYQTASAATRVVARGIDNATEGAYSTSAIFQNASATVQGVTFGGLQDQAPELDNAATQLTRGANKVQRVNREYIPPISTALQTIRITTYIILALSVLLPLLALLSLCLDWPRVLLLLLPLLWLLATWTWVWVGLTLSEARALHVACSLVSGYRQDPERSPLNELLPCEELAAQAPRLRQAEGAISTFTAQLNDILPLASQLGGPGTPPPPPPLCDPFPQSASAPAPAAPPGNQQPGCLEIGAFVPRFVAFYEQLAAAQPQLANAVVGLSPGQVRSIAFSLRDVVEAVPDVWSFVRCTPVDRVLNAVEASHCADLRWASSLLWSSLLIVAIGLTLFSLLSLASALVLLAARKRRLHGPLSSTTAAAPADWRGG